MQEREYLMSSTWGNTNRFLAPWGMRVVQERWVQPHFRVLETPGEFQLPLLCPRSETYCDFIVRAK